MDKRTEREVLWAHADRLVSPQAQPPPNLTRYDQVQGLLELAEQIHAILVPVEPNANFRRRLHGELILEAQRRQLEPSVGFMRQHRKGLLIGAAAAGSAVSVVAGVILAFFLRYRQGRAHIAAG